MVRAEDGSIVQKLIKIDSPSMLVSAIFVLLTNII
jgi:hypothetical protein